MPRSLNRYVPVPPADPVTPPLEQVSANSENMQQNVTECNTFEHFGLPRLPDADVEKLTLTARQQQVINLLVTGSTMTAAARAVGISSVTIHRWKTFNPLFMAELNRRQQEIWETASNRLRMLSIRALGIIQAGLQDDYEEIRRNSAFKFLPRLMSNPGMAPVKPIAPEGIIDVMIRERWTRRGEDSQRPITDDDRVEMLRLCCEMQSRAEAYEPDELDWEKAE